MTTMPASRRHDLHKGAKTTLGTRLRNAINPAARTPRGVSKPSPDKCVIDYSWGRPPISKMVSYGLDGVVRYLSHDPTKNLSPAERDALLKAGRSISLVWQQGKTGPKRGAVGGKEDALAADRLANSLGAPSWLPIFFAVDFDPTSADWATIDAYFKAVLAYSKRPVGIYGGFRTIERFASTVPYRWQCVAWSGGRVSSHAHFLQQAGNTWYTFSEATDANILLKPFPKWGRTAAAPPAPTPPPAPVEVAHRIRWYHSN